MGGANCPFAAACSFAAATCWSCWAFAATVACSPCCQLQRQRSPATAVLRNILATLALCQMTLAEVPAILEPGATGLAFRGRITPALTDPACGILALVRRLKPPRSG